MKVTLFVCLFVTFVGADYTWDGAEWKWEGETAGDKQTNNANNLGFRGSDKKIGNSKSDKSIEVEGSGDEYYDDDEEEDWDDDDYNNNNNRFDSPTYGSNDDEDFDDEGSGDSDFGTARFPISHSDKHPGKNGERKESTVLDYDYEKEKENDINVDAPTNNYGYGGQDHSNVGSPSRDYDDYGESGHDYGGLGHSNVGNPARDYDAPNNNYGYGEQDHSNVGNPSHDYGDYGEPGRDNGDISFGTDIDQRVPFVEVTSQPKVPSPTTTTTTTTERQPVWGTGDQEDGVEVHRKGPTGTRPASFFAQPGILAAVIGGAVVGLLCAILLVMFIVYRMRKKDEGSYALDEPKRAHNVNSYAKPPSREFYA